MSDDKIVPLPDTFKPIGYFTNKIVERLKAQREKAPATEPTTENQKGKSK